MLSVDGHVILRLASQPSASWLGERSPAVGLSRAFGVTLQLALALVGSSPRSPPSSARHRGARPRRRARVAPAHIEHLGTAPDGCRWLSSGLRRHFAVRAGPDCARLLRYGAGAQPSLTAEGGPRGSLLRLSEICCCVGRLTRRRRSEARRRGARPRRRARVAPAHIEPRGGRRLMGAADPSKSPVHAVCPVKGSSASGAEHGRARRLDPDRSGPAPRRCRIHYVRSKR